MPACPPHSRNDVHIWLGFLDQPSSLVQQLLQTLSSDERDRAARFYFEKDMDQYIVGRGLLRTILSHYLDVGADELKFCYGRQGKPALGERPHSQLHFNLSHSHALCLYAIAWERHVGVDLELVRPIPEAGQIIKSFCSVRENALFLAVPPTRRQETFFRWWTWKEAYIKGIGDGLGRPLEQIDVFADSDKAVVAASAMGEMHRKVEWHLQTIRPVQGYVGALALEGPGSSPTFWRYKDFTANEFVQVTQLDGR